MTDDPRIDAMIKETGFGRWRVECILAEIDGVDPLRQVRRDRVEAALDAWFGHELWRASPNRDDSTREQFEASERARMSRALAAADLVCRRIV